MTLRSFLHLVRVGGDAISDVQKSARSTFRGDRQLEAVRVHQAEGSDTPGHVGRLGLQRAAPLLDFRRDLVHVVARGEVEPEPLTLRTVAALGPSSCARMRWAAPATRETPPTLPSCSQVSFTWKPTTSRYHARLASMSPTVNAGDILRRRRCSRPRWSLRSSGTSDSLLMGISIHAQVESGARSAAPLAAPT